MTKTAAITGTLFFFCGKMGAGKSTKAAEIAADRQAILISEDRWLAALYPDQIHTLSDYVTYSNRLKPQIKQMTQDLLIKNIDVVLDFPANTRKQRIWFRDIFADIKVPHCLIYLDVSDHTCLAHLEKRRMAEPERVNTDTEAMFTQVTQYFTAPTAKEGFNIVVL